MKKLEKNSVYYAKTEKKASVTILVLDKVNFKIRNVISDEKGQFMIKGSVYDESITCTGGRIAKCYRHFGKQF